MPEELIFFTRYPEAGKVKTRLIPALGVQGACDLHRRMTELKIRQIRELASFRPVSVRLCIENGDESLMQEWLGPGPKFSRQGPGDLGRRMDLAFQEAFRKGCDRVVLIGSDCPGLTPEIMDRAFEELRSHDLVLGPAVDGGYYLIGLQKPQPLFADIPWGSREVFNLTMDQAGRLGLKTSLLERLNDIDRPEDLPVWEKINALLTEPRPDISIIIPALNEAGQLPLTLKRIPKNPDLEILVVDGGSHDQTRESAAALGAEVLDSARGRARQMNTGAGRARGKYLLFLHADTLLPEGFTGHVRHILSRPGVSAGAFELKFDPPLPGLKIIENLANWRARVLQLPYGDQAVFLRAGRFQALKGFAEIPIMEDLELILRLRRQGTIAIAPAAAVTSSRRWEKNGVWRTSLKNQAALLAYGIGISPERLARWYHRRNRRETEGGK